MPRWRTDSDGTIDIYGEVTEWLKVHAWKVCVRGNSHREFESHPLRQAKAMREQFPPTHDHERKQRFKDLLVFEVMQPDGRQLSVDMSAPGGYGDFAFTTRPTDRPGGREHFFMYWLSEMELFLQLFKRMATERGMGAFEQDIEHIRGIMRELCAAGCHETTQGQGRVDAYDIRGIMRPEGGSQRVYRMFSGGDDRLIVDTTGPITCLRVDREWDEGQRKQVDLYLPDEVLWRFVSGMIGRSFTTDGGEYVQLTRFSTAVYMDAMSQAMTIVNDTKM